MLGARFLPRAVFLGGALAIVVAAVVMTSLLWAGDSPASAQDDGETKVPAKPTGLSVATEQGSLDVLVEWDDVGGADDYLVRWRPKDGQLNDGARVGSSSAAITVDDYGEWVVRVQACNDAGCGKPLAKQFRVEPAPEPTPEPTREPTPEPTPEPTREPTPDFRVSITADATELKVNEEVTLTAVITNAPTRRGPEYQWQLDLGGGSWYSAGTEATFSYLQNNAGSSAFRVTVTYGSGDSATSDPITITWEESEILAVCDRTSQVRDVLVELLGKACENIGAEDLAEVVKLDLSNTGLSSLKSRDFSGMSNLRSVDASSNTFASWTDACAAKYGDSVQNINLAYNYLGGTGAGIPSGCFTSSKFPNLKSLHLAGNRINSLAGSPFLGLTNLYWLDLSQNQIALVPVGTFEDLSNLWYLDLGRNELTSSGLPVTINGGVVTDAVFDNLSSLEWLALNNQFEQDETNNFKPKTTALLTKLDASVFKGLSSLKELDLANNGFSKTAPNILPNNMFTPLTSLESLALFGNPGAPWTATQLTALKVRSEASVIQVVTPPTGFEIEPVSGGVKLSWDDPSDTSMSHEYRYLVVDGADWIDWTDISSPTTSGTKLEHTVSSGLSSGKSYAFQLRSEKSGAHSYRADADCTANFGTSGNDTLTGGDHQDCLLGLAGNDTLKGLGGADKLDGGAGTDTASYQGSAFQGVTVNLSDDTASGGGAKGDSLDNIENITGSKYSDSLTGDGSANVLTGGKGDDILEGLAGGDTLWGEAGSDTLSYASSNAAVTVNLAAGTASGGHAAGDKFGGIENLIGSAHADTLTGHANANVIEGGGGGDTMNGAAGSDTLIYTGSSAAVTVTINSGTGSGGDAQGDTNTNFENILGSAHADTLTGDSSANVIEGGAGGDTLDCAGGTDTLIYAGSNAAVTVSLNDGTGSGGEADGDTISNCENITGTDYDDTLTGDGSANVLTGGKGDDMLEGLAGGDTLWGEAGNDTLSYASSNAAVTVILADGTASGGHAAGDTWGGIENLIGSAHADTLTGDSKDNVIEGGAGGDTLSGGTGADTLSYASSPRFVEVSLVDSTQICCGHAEGDTISGFENFLGSDYADWFEGDAKDNLIYGSAGRDTYDGGAGNDTLTYASFDTGVHVNVDGKDDIVSNIEIIILTDYDDTINGDSIDNTIRGGEGNDTIVALAGDDKLYGGNGNDQFRGGSGADTIDGGSGSDTARYWDSPAAVTVNLTTGTHTGGHAQGDTLISIEHIVGSTHNDKLTGDEGINYLDGGAGADAFDGKGGEDWVIYYAGQGTAGLTLDMATPANSTGHAKGDTFTSIERIVGTKYDDTMTGNSDDNDLSGYQGDDTVKGGAGDDIIYGGKGADELYGDAGDDMIHGGVVGFWEGGIDDIRGGAGNDKLSAVEGFSQMRGGTGTDEFYFMGRREQAENHSIYDYASGEKIWICRGSGKGTADGEVSWTEAAGNAGGHPTLTDDWKITVSAKKGSADVEVAVIWLLGVSTSPGTDIAWSDPAAAVGTGCNFIEPWTPWNLRNRFPPQWDEGN